PTQRQLFYQRYTAHPNLPSFPTRRSSDLDYPETRGSHATDSSYTHHARTCDVRVAFSGRARLWRRWPAGAGMRLGKRKQRGRRKERKSTRLNSSHVARSYAVFCLKKKTNT